MVIYVLFYNNLFKADRAPVFLFTFQVFLTSKHMEKIQAASEEAIKKVTVVQKSKLHIILLLFYSLDLIDKPMVKAKDTRPVGTL